MPFPINFQFYLETPNIKKEDLNCLLQNMTSLVTLWENMVSQEKDQLLIRSPELIITFNDFLVFECHGKKDLRIYVNVRQGVEIKKHTFFPAIDFLMILWPSYPVEFKESSLRFTLENLSEFDHLFGLIEN